MKYLNYDLKIIFSFLVIFQYSYSLANDATNNKIDNLSIEQDLFSDFSVTSATRLAQSPRDLPVSVTIITRRMIDASGATEIPDLFRLVPGFRVGMVDGGFYTVIGQGEGNQYGRKLEVLIDGMPMQSPVINFVDWLSLPIEIDDIDYIEVMRGTSVAVYGANAFEGVINIVTKKPFEEKGMYYRLLVGDPNVTGVQLKYSFLSGTSSHSLSGYFKENTGFEGVNDSGENSKLRYSGDFSLSSKDELEVMLGFNTGFKLEEGDGVFLIKRPRDVDSQQQYFRWNHRYDSGNEFTLKAYHHYVNYNDPFQTALLSEISGVAPADIPVLLNGKADQTISFGLYDSKSNRYGLDIQQSFDYSTIRFILGSSIIYDIIKSDYAFTVKRESTGLNKQFFGKLEWGIKNDLILNASAMYEIADNRKGEISPRVSLNYHLNEENTIRISVARSYRSQSAYFAGLNLGTRYTIDKSVYDKLYDFRSYKQPEKIDSYELAHLISYPNNFITFDWRLYQEIYNDLRLFETDASIVDDAGDGAGVTRNGGGYDIKGFQSQFKYEPSQNGFVSLHYSFASATGKVTGETPSTFLDQSDAVPRYVYGILLNRKLIKGVFLGLNYSQVSKVTWRNDGGPVPQYDRLDINLSNGFNIGSGKAKIEFIAHNILDSYKEFINNNTFDTRYLVRFSLKHY